jgi:hypothetical protein
MQAASEDAPVLLLKVPAAHGVGFNDDHGQKWPAGQKMGTPEEQ